MSTMISEVYDAFKEAGASEEKARKAAEALTNYDARLNKIENELATFRVETKGEFNWLQPRHDHRRPVESLFHLTRSVP